MCSILLKCNCFTYELTGVAQHLMLVLTELCGREELKDVQGCLKTQLLKGLHLHHVVRINDSTRLSFVKYVDIFKRATVSNILL